jgi:uncharacterized protein with HEPN domain
LRDDGERLTDILEAIERAQRYAVRGRSAFEQDELIQAWMIQQLMVIGEAASRLSRPIRERAPDVPWRTVVGLRNRLVHAYFQADLSLVWSVVENDLPQLRKAVLELLGETGAGPAGGQTR